LTRRASSTKYILLAGNILQSLLPGAVSRFLFHRVRLLLLLQLLVIMAASLMYGSIGF